MKKILNRCQSSWQWFLSALFPAKCLICSKEGAFLCEKHRDIKPAPQNKARFKHLDTIYACVSYADPIAEKSILNFKYQGIKELGEIFANIIKEKTPSEIWEEKTIIPIPLHWTRKLWRGYNQSEILAREIQKKIPKIQICTNLKRIKKTKQQAKLKKEDRIKNLNNCFVWKSNKTPPSHVLLIDDVVATGTTLDEAARILKKSGTKKVMALVFARGGR